MARGPGRNLGDDQDYTGLPDEEIRRAVLEHLEADQTVDASDIEVSVEDGAVRLGGTVGSEVEREMAERIVTDLIGLDVAADELRVEPAEREGRETDSGEQATGTAPQEIEAEPELSEALGTEDAGEASDEGRSFTPPDTPAAEAFGATDPAHGVAEDQPRPTNEGTRSPLVDEAVGRAMEEVSRPGLRRVATESAEQFKEAMRRREGRGKGGRSGPS
ncbi:MAG TPA: BON domain-containing protein [Actinomycetota bacterium]|nr:BON domain-containing protein [Actinomycetota bacterium]